MVLTSYQNFSHYYDFENHTTKPKLAGPLADGVSDNLCNPPYLRTSMLPPRYAQYSTYSTHSTHSTNNTYSAYSTYSTNPTNRTYSAYSTVHTVQTVHTVHTVHTVQIFYTYGTQQKQKNKNTIVPPFYSKKTQSIRMWRSDETFGLHGCPLA